MDESPLERLRLRLAAIRGRLEAHLADARRQMDDAARHQAAHEAALAGRLREELAAYDEQRDEMDPAEREAVLDVLAGAFAALSRAPAEAPPADGGAACARSLRLLVDAGRVLGGRLEYEAALDRLARLAVAWFADACAVHLAGDGRVRCVAAVSGGAAGEAVLAALGVDGCDDPAHPVTAALREGAPPPRAASRDGRTLLLPLHAGERVLGALTLARGAGAPPYSGDETALAEELARRAVHAVEEARLRGEVERAERARSEFVGTISHEFRTPLMTVMAFGHLLQEGIPVPIPGEAQPHVDRILAAAGHLDRLVEESLGFRRADAGWDAPRPAPVDLAALARETAGLVEPLARQKGLEVALEVGDAPVVARTDADKVRQILFSLLGNAVKFTDRGQVRLALRAEPGRAVFEVSDTGIGIAREHLEHVFEPFWQAEPGNHTRGPGIGLGLALARRLAWLLGGRVSARSDPGRGSTFRAELPLG